MNLICNRIIIFVFFMFVTLFSFGQKSEIDSLKIELQNHKIKDTLRVDLLFDIGHYYHRKDFDKAMEYLNESLTLSDSLNYTYGKARSLYFKGLTLAIKTNSKKGVDFFNESYFEYQKINDKGGMVRSKEAVAIFLFQNSEYQKSLENRLEVIKIKEELGDKKRLLFGLFDIAATYNRLGNYNDSFAYYKKAIELAEEIDNKTVIADCYSDMGNIYGHQGNLTLALEYHNKSMTIGKEIEDNKVICDALISMGSIYNANENYDKAIEFYEDALEISEKNNFKRNITSIINNLGTSYFSKKDYPRALKFYERSLKASKEEGNLINTAISLNNIGLLYFKQKEYNLALKYYEKSKKINLDLGSKSSLASTYAGISEVYYTKKIYDKALLNAKKAKNIADELNLLESQKIANELLSKIYAGTGNYKNAFKSHQQFKILNDSLFNKENIEKLAQLEAEYKYQQALDSASIKELELTRTVTETNKSLAKTQRNYLWTIIGVLLVSMLLGSVIFYQKLKNAKTKTQNAVIEQKLLRSQMTPHFIFNSLSVLQGMILNKEEKKSVNYLSKFSKLLRITLENSRDKTVSLSQELKAVQNYLMLQNLENDAYKSTILVEDSINVPKFEVPPMLIQPFVENAIEHAFEKKKEDKKIDIRLKYKNQQLICTIADNGIGYTAQKTVKNGNKKSLSTTITSERLKMLSKDFNMEGSVTIEDRKVFNEQGTIVTLVIPHKIIPS